MPQLLDQTGYIPNQTAMLNTLLTLITAMLILAIMIALLGVVNTLALSVAERIREIGLLRAIGMQRGQVRKMMAAESAIIAVIGAVLGTVLGIGLGIALALALTQSQQATITIPVSHLIVYILGTGRSRVLACVAPPGGRPASTCSPRSRPSELKPGSLGTKDLISRPGWARAVGNGQAPLGLGAVQEILGFRPT